MNFDKTQQTIICKIKDCHRKQAQYGKIVEFSKLLFEQIFSLKIGKSQKIEILNIC